MRYDIIAKNRFTGKVYEEHENKGINAVYQVQDYFFFQPWIKVEVYPVEEYEGEYEEIMRVREENECD